MLEHTKKDLDALRFTFKRGDAVPKFHYEVRAFSRVVCNTDLTDNDLEFSIIQGINYTGANPKEMQTYCRYLMMSSMSNHLWVRIESFAYTYY